MNQEVQLKRRSKTSNTRKKKRKNRTLFILMSILLCGTLVYTGYVIYQMNIPNLRAQEGLKKADVALKNKPDTPKIPDKIEYSKGYTYGKLRIPSINMEVALTEGLSPDKNDTRKDANLLDYTVAHVNITKHPGQKSQIYLAGHNDMQFNNLGNIKDKAEIFVDMPYGTFKYIVHATPTKDYPEQKVGAVIKEERSDAIVPDLGYEELVLQTCYPLNQYRDTQFRFLIYAYPEGQTPKVSLQGYEG